MPKQNSQSEQKTSRDLLSNQRSVVMSLAKGLRILECFGAGGEQLRQTDVARRAGVDNATAFRFLNTLEALGYVARHEDGRHFRLTLKCLDLGFNAIARTPLRDLAHPLLKSLVGHDVEAASLAVQDGTVMVYIDRIQAGLARLGIEMHIGGRVPMFSTAIGRVILAALPEDAARQLLDASDRNPMTAQTITSTAQILKLLPGIRKQGYALVEGENVPGLRIIAAPILDGTGAPLAAISAAAPTFGLKTQDFVSQIAPRIVAASHTLGQAMRAHGGLRSQNQPSQPPRKVTASKQSRT